MKKVNFKHLFNFGGGFKNKILKVILLVVLILGVGGLTYAAFTSDFSSNANTITSGVVSMSFSESSSVITLNNALPINDSEGKVQTNYFDFSITSNLTLNNSDPSEDVNYDIIIEPLAVDTDYTALTNDQIKVYLENKADNSVLVEPTLISNLNDSGSNKILLSTSHTHKYGVNTVVTNYRLRVWIDINVDASSWTSSTKLEYKFRININGDADALEKKLYNVLRDNVNTSVTPNFQYINNYNTNGINTNDSGVFLYNGTDDNAGDKNIYYYRGNVTDNNVVFGGYCWKMIRTTSTGGVKMIYNGKPILTYDKDLVPIEQTDYKNLSNDETYPFTYDSTNKMWISSNDSDFYFTTSEISFTIDNPNNKNYYLSYTTTDLAEYMNYVNFYIDGMEIAVSSDGENGTIDLGILTSSNVIMVEYVRSFSSETDNVIFSIGTYPDDAVETFVSCNTGKDSQLSTKSSFNSNTSSPADVGYMYGERYTYSSKVMTSITDTYVYGNDVTYSDGTYTLNDTTTSIGTNWNTDRSTLANGKHYTCFTTEEACSTVYYINYFGDETTAYYLTFTFGDTLDTAKEKMYTNTNNSTIKTVLDNWYSTNLSTYSSYLENTIFCNERTLYSGPLYSKDANSTSYSNYKIVQRLPGSPSLTCLNNNDKFSLSVANGGTANYGNNALTYPIGLITADEISIAGGRVYQINNNFYLYNGATYWSLSPSYWNDRNSYAFYLHSSGYLNDGGVKGSLGVRPVISLKPETAITGGDGSYTDPYVVG